MLGVFVTILTVILVFICLVMSLVILMQRPKQEGLGAAFGGALTDRMLGSGTTDFLQRATVFMGVAFFLLSLTIATLMAYDRNADRQSQIDRVKQAALAEAVAPVDTDAADDNAAAPPVPAGDVAPEIAAPEFEVSMPELTPPDTAAETTPPPATGAEEATNDAAPANLEEGDPADGDNSPGN